MGKRNVGETWRKKETGPKPRFTRTGLAPTSAKDNPEACERKGQNRFTHAKIEKKRWGMKIKPPQHIPRRVRESHLITRDLHTTIIIEIRKI